MAKKKQEKHFRGAKSSCWRGCGKISGRAWYLIKRTAKRRNIKFDLSIKDAWEIFQKQKGKCALSKIKLKFPTTSRSKDGNASLDRIDSSGMYELKNVQWLDRRVNFMKQALQENEFIFLCRKIANNFKYKRLK